MKQKSKNYQSRQAHRPDFNEQKKSISFVDVLSHYNLLEQMNRSGDQLRCACPIHNEAKNQTSFSVSATKNWFNCFSCGSGGDIIKFVMVMEGCRAYRAACLLEQWFPLAGASVDTGQDAGTGKGVKRVQEKKKGVGGGNVGGHCDDGNSNDGVVGFSKCSSVQQTSSCSEINLVHCGINKPLTFTLKNLDTKHPYLLARVQPKTIEYFGLGVCGVGLMKGRAVVPIHDEIGQLVAYAGRLPSDGDFPENEGKYKFPVDFKKGYVLFNFHRVVEAVKAGEPLILVEGFFDVFRLYELGFSNVVALMGASLTNEQEGLLKSVLTPLSRVVLFFDNDSAGLACRRDVAVRLSVWCFIKIVGLPEGIRQPDQLKERIEIF